MRKKQVLHFGSSLFKHFLFTYIFSLSLIFFSCSRDKTSNRDPSSLTEFQKFIPQNCFQNFSSLGNEIWNRKTTVERLDHEYTCLITIVNTFLVKTEGSIDENTYSKKDILKLLKNGLKFNSIPDTSVDDLFWMKAFFTGGSLETLTKGEVKAFKSVLEDTRPLWKEVFYQWLEPRNSNSRAVTPLFIDTFSNALQSSVYRFEISPKLTYKNRTLKDFWINLFKLLEQFYPNFLTGYLDLKDKLIDKTLPFKTTEDGFFFRFILYFQNLLDSRRENHVAYERLSKSPLDSLSEDINTWRVLLKILLKSRGLLDDPTPRLSFYIESIFSLLEAFLKPDERVITAKNYTGSKPSYYLDVEALSQFWVELRQEPLPIQLLHIFSGKKEHIFAFLREAKRAFFGGDPNTLALEDLQNLRTRTHKKLISITEQWDNIIQNVSIYPSSRVEDLLNLYQNLQRELTEFQVLTEDWDLSFTPLILSESADADQTLLWARAVVQSLPSFFQILDERLPLKDSSRKPFVFLKRMEQGFWLSFAKILLTLEIFPFLLNQTSSWVKDSGILEIISFASLDFLYTLMPTHINCLDVRKIFPILKAFEDQTLINGVTKNAIEEALSFAVDYVLNDYNANFINKKGKNYCLRREQLQFLGDLWVSYGKTQRYLENLFKIKNNDPPAFTYVEDFALRVLTQANESDHQIAPVFRDTRYNERLFHTYLASDGSSRLQLSKKFLNRKPVWYLHYINLIRLIPDILVFMASADKTRIPVSTFKTLSPYFFSIFMKFGIIRNVDPEFFMKRMKESDLFMPSSDGNLQFDYFEMLEIIQFLFSDVNEKKHIDQLLKTQCSPTQGTATEPFLEYSCWEKVHLEHFFSIFDGFMDGKFWYLLLSRGELSKLLKSALNSAGAEILQERYVLLTETHLVPHLLKFVESLLLKYDLNQNMQIETEEAMQAYPVFRMLVDQNPYLFTESMKRAGFGYLLARRRTPKTATEIFDFWNSFLRASEKSWCIRVARDGLVDIFEYLNDLASKSASSTKSKNVTTKILQE